MANATTVQQTAHHTIPQLLRALAQQKWANAHAEELKFKAAEINTKVELSDIISRAYRSMRGAYISSVKDDPFHELIGKVKELSLTQEQARRASFEGEHAEDLIAPVAQLRAAPAEDKRSVLRANHVVSVAVAAAYLGVTAAALHALTAIYTKFIGARYAGGYCLSIDEVFMIEKNMNWFDNMYWYDGKSTATAQVTAKPDETAFDHLLYLDTEIACAYTDMTQIELSKAVRRSAQSRRPFRLSDLEKIRVAKLNAIA